jgi:CheY-like chemotaxis protein
VVEDAATQRQLLADYLAGQNFRVSAVDGGAALHRLVEREAPALVLLDVGLPGEDGFALARQLREKSSRIGIIMVTSAADTEGSAAPCRCRRGRGRATPDARRLPSRVAGAATALPSAGSSRANYRRS